MTGKRSGVDRRKRSTRVHSSVQSCAIDCWCVEPETKARSGHGGLARKADVGEANRTVLARWCRPGSMRLVCGRIRAHRDFERSGRGRAGKEVRGMLEKPLVATS